MSAGRCASSYYLAFFNGPNHLNLDHTGLLYNVPGKLAQLSSARENAETIAGFVFASELLDHDYRDIRQQKDIVTGVHSGGLGSPQADRGHVGGA